jgi:diguanylate cyclase (GGDEF)-like protein
LSSHTRPVNIPGRVELLQQLDRSISDCSGGDGCFALLVFNLQNFREINIEYGHAGGDIVLAQVAERVESVLRSGDSLFHIGNDEFAVLLTQLKTPHVIQLAITKLQEVISNNMDVGGNVLLVTVAAGAALFPDHSDDRDGLMKAADTALHYARDKGIPFSIYDWSVCRTKKQFSDLRGGLKTALDNSDLRLFYQPQIDLQHGTLGGCEALARWKHSAHSWIPPDVFIPVAEKSNLIDALTYWSINAALREWPKFCDSCSSATVAINLSAKLLRSPEVVDLVRRAINIWGADPGSIVLEVTESAMITDPRASLRTLLALHEMGITLSIDDFGTGYSSLAYLKKLPVSELKIDKSFVQHMADSPQDRKIVQSVIDLSHNLELSVVAEGIESQQILDMLIGMGCDYGQGYYIGKPMPIGELPPWIKGSNWHLPGHASV